MIRPKAQRELPRFVIGKSDQRGNGAQVDAATAGFTVQLHLLQHGGRIE